MKKQNTRREFIKRGAQIAGAGLLTTGLLGCNALLDETDGGGLLLKGDCGKILYQNGSNNLFILDLNRNFQVTPVGSITVSNIGDFSLSPDRTRIAYLKPIGFNQQLHTINVNGTSDVYLSAVGTSLFGPRYSFDGSQIVYVVPDVDLSTIPAGGGSINIVIGGTGYGIYPTWSPDGNKIAYVDDSTDRISTVTTGGTILSTPNVLTTTYERPSWSPDGSKLLFVHTGNIYTANPSTNYGLGLGDLLLSGAGITSPHWSPSGEQFAYISGGQIYIANSDGSNSKPCPGVSGVVALEWR